MISLLLTLGTLLAIYLVVLFILWPKNGGFFNDIEKAIALSWPIILIASLFRWRRNPPK